MSGARTHQAVGDEEQRDGGDELEIRDREEQGDDGCGEDPQHDGAQAAEHDRPPALPLRETARRHPDDQRVVAGQGKVDQDDREDRLDRLDHLARAVELTEHDDRDAGEPDEDRGDVTGGLRRRRELNVVEKACRHGVEHHDSILSHRRRPCRVGDMR